MSKWEISMLATCLLSLTFIALAGLFTVIHGLF